MATPQDEMHRTKVERMLKEARARLADGEILSETSATQSDADYLLKLLAFEILLKATHLVHVGPPGKSHSYGQLFNGLPSELQSKLVEEAADRMSTGADYSNVPELLSIFQQNFVALRYPYEAYEHLSHEEYRRLGEAWAKRKAPEEEATFVYRPEELFGLAHALDQHLESWLNSHGQSG